MSKILISALLILTAGTAVYAADIIELPASRGNIPFPHQKHQGMPIECTICHEPGPWKIPKLGKEWGHTVCRGCHADTAKAPINCAGCHRLAPTKK